MVDSTFEQSYSALLENGEHALARGEWPAARRCFEQAVAHAETPQALEGLGVAAQWQDDVVVMFDAFLRAYQQYLQEDDLRSAARVAAFLAYNYFAFRGERAVANGWVQRAGRLLEGLEPGFEHGLLSVLEGHLALLLDNDGPKAQARGEQAAELARTLGLIDIEMMGLALVGMARVSAGEIPAGMQLLDGCTAAAVSGEINDPDAQTMVCCYLIRACEYVRDFERAAQWCGHLRAISFHWDYPMMFAYCRVHYACVLIWQGEWTEAEKILVSATEDLMTARPVEAAAGIVQLAGLRRKQGRIDEAQELVGQINTPSLQILGGFPALLERAALALTRDDPSTAVGLVERYLRQMPLANRIERPWALELLIAARLAQGETDRAQEALDELQTIAMSIATDPLRGMAAMASGAVAGARGDLEAACHCYEDAVDLFRRSGAPYETAHAHLGLAQTLFALERFAPAAEQAQNAYELCCNLGAGEIHTAARWVEKAQNAAVSHADAQLAVPPTMHTSPLSEPGAPNSSLNGDETNGVETPVERLSQREIEILQLVATGNSNQGIAEQLVLSVRTVERHISNIYEKLGFQGKSARAAVTTFANQHGFLDRIA